MSAFMVPVEHIRALVNAGLHLEYGPMTWPIRSLTDEEKNIVYEPGLPWGPGAAQVYGQVRRQLTADNAEWVGAMLLAENRRSVDYRYDEHGIEDLYTHGGPDPVARWRPSKPSTATPTKRAKPRTGSTAKRTTSARHCESR